MRYLLFIARPGGDPEDAVLGAMAVPGCFSPNDAFLAVAKDLGLAVAILDEDPQAAPIPDYLLDDGRTIFDTIVAHPALAADPKLN